MANDITKTAYEKFPIYADFSYEVAAGDFISSQTLTCVNALTGADTKTAIIDSHTISSDQIVIVVKNGTVNGTHHITSKAVTVTGIKPERDIFLTIKNITNGFFEKQPSEAFNIQCDFKNRVGSESIDTENVTAVKISDDSDATADVISFSKKDGKVVIVGVKDGIDNESYLILCKAVTDDNAYQFENIIRMDIIER